MRAALGGVPDAGLRADLGRSDPEELVRIAVHNYVHVVLAGAFERHPELAEAVPRDLVIFFDEMRAANVRRNESIRAELVAIGAILTAAGIRGVALKGGAELLAPVFPEPGFRFLSDVDILVPEVKLDAAVTALRASGALTGDIEATDIPAEHHYWPLYRNDWSVPLELHVNLGGGDIGRILPAKEILRDAVEVNNIGLGVPAPAHRMAHGVIHGQVKSGNQDAGRLSLRDAMEFEVLSAALSKAEVDAARALLARGDAGASWDALAAARSLIFADAADIAALDPAARRWAEAALARFGRPRRERAAAMLRWGIEHLRAFFTDSGQRRRYLHFLSRPRRLRKALARHLETWRRMR